MTVRLRRTLMVITVLALGAFGVWYYVKRSHPTTFTYRTVKVERRRIAAQVTSTGTLSANVTVQVGTQVSGRVAEINVDFDSIVKKGQIIARIEPQLFAAALAQARANLVAAQGNLDKARVQLLDAERQFARARALRAEGLAAEAAVETAETAASVARAQVEVSKGQAEQARAAVQEAEINLEYTKIVSPIDGVVISRSVDVGQTVAASLQAPTLFTIAQDLRKMQVDTNIAEGDVGKLLPDMPASFVVDAYPNERFSGRIRQIRSAPQSVQNVVTYDAVIDVDNPELKLKPGMTANVTLVYAERNGVLAVPNPALRFRPPGGSPPDRKSVWALRGAQPEPVAISTGLTDGAVTEIVESEVKEGDELVVEATSSDGSSAAQKTASGASQRLRL